MCLNIRRVHHFEFHQRLHESQLTRCVPPRHRGKCHTHWKTFPRFQCLRNPPQPKKILRSNIVGNILLRSSYSRCMILASFPSTKQNTVSSVAECLFNHMEHMRLNLCNFATFHQYAPIELVWTVHFCGSKLSPQTLNGIKAFVESAEGLSPSLSLLPVESFLFCKLTHVCTLRPELNGQTSQQQHTLAGAG